MGEAERRGRGVLEAELEDLGGLAVPQAGVEDAASARDEAGAAVGFAGNPNGDCCDDLIIGAPEADDAGSGSGSVYVVFGVGI